ncbi:MULTISPECIES: hypothetical protein [unclassified Chitinophaga]|uniref:hypothetical protein n=1 Tax=unclassified Chitinophaga TaxID=2619133 RepID=UPI00300FE836
MYISKVALTVTIFLAHSHPLFPDWLLLISFTFNVSGDLQFLKVVSERQSTEVVSLSKEGFTSFYFGSALFSEIRSIRVCVREIGLLGGTQCDYYKKTDADFPYLEFSITTQDGKMLNWILNEWGGLYNSKEDFSTFFNFLTALTDQPYQLYE